MMTWYDAKKWEPVVGEVVEVEVGGKNMGAAWRDGLYVRWVESPTAKCPFTKWRDVTAWRYVLSRPTAPIPVFGKESTAEHLRWWCGDDEVKVMVADLPEWATWCAIGGKFPFNEYFITYFCREAGVYMNTCWHTSGKERKGTPAPPSIARHWRDSLLEVVREKPTPRLTTHLDDETATWRLGKEVVTVHRSDVSPDAVALCAVGNGIIFECQLEPDDGEWRLTFTILRGRLKFNHDSMYEKSLIHLPAGWGTKGVEDEGEPKQYKLRNCNLPTQAQWVTRAEYDPEYADLVRLELGLEGDAWVFAGNGGQTIADLLTGFDKVEVKE
ncbi:MAG TPA: hypothetical protein VLL52_17340 [Anaerolineae bacterium]|nr:hypothetical protein [Anaerolineae bacterium]